MSNLLGTFVYTYIMMYLAVLCERFRAYCEAQEKACEAKEKSTS